MAKEQSHSDSKKELFGENYVELSEFKPTGKLPTGTIVIGRLLALCKKGVKGKKKSMSRDEACMTVANELRTDWINKNVYPKHERSVAKKMKEDYERFNQMRKNERCTAKVKSDEWYKNAKEFNDYLTSRAYNIRTDDDAYQRQLEDEYGVKMTKEDEEFYLDNCFGPYKATCSNTVPKDWAKQKKRKETRQRSVEKRRRSTESSLLEQKEIDESEMREMLATPMVEIDDDPNFQYETPSEQTVPSG